MADGPIDSGSANGRTGFWSSPIFRCFQIALDPRKLAVAAGGILAMALGWYVLSALFYYDPPNPNDSKYSIEQVTRDVAGKKTPAGTDYTDKDIAAEITQRRARDYEQWLALQRLAGPSVKDPYDDKRLLPAGKIRAMPWYEDRGLNPYDFLKRLASSPSSAWFDSTWNYLKQQLPVMAEPLTKLFLPIVKIMDPNATFATRLYLFLVLVWNVLVWAFAGGVITRIAAVQISGKDRVSIFGACRYVCNRYVSYALAPMVPLGVVGAVVVGICILGIICLIPIVGDLLLGTIGLPLVILGGIIMTVLFIGLVGYPLMNSTLSAEGSDTFDALSRSYNYVFQAPWTYAWNWIIAILYGTIVTFFVVFVASLMVYLGKWALTMTPLSETTNQKADYLFIYAPESFGWKELLLKNTSIEVVREPGTYQYVYADPERANKYIDSYKFWNWIGAGLTTFWLVVVFLFMLGFSYSFFWSASTMIYLLMRNKVDEVELDDVYLEEEEEPVPPPSPISISPPPVAPASLPMVPPPPEPNPPASPG